MGSLVKSVYKTSIGKGGLSGLSITFGLTLGYKARRGFKAYLNLHAFDREVLSALTESLWLSGQGRGDDKRCPGKNYRTR